MCTKMSGVPSPRVRKPNPRSRLNHLTCARSSPLVGGHGHMGARRGHLRGMHRRRILHGENAERLQAARALQHLDHDARALIGDLEAVAPEAGHVQENIGHPVVGDDEAVALGDVKPFDDAGELDDARRLVTNTRHRGAVDPQTAARSLRFHSVRRHDAPTPPLRRFQSWRILVRASNLIPSGRYHSAANGKGQNAIARQKRWKAVYIFATVARI